MTKRLITATFKNGTTNSRTTTLATLKYGWRVTGATGGIIVQGFSSSNARMSPDAVAALKHQPNRVYEIVEVTEQPARKR